jgi:two-component system sensor histidine kinase KdpD
VRGLLRVAAQRNVTQIVVGKPVGGPLWKLFQRDLVLRRLVRGSGDIDIHFVRAGKAEPRSRLGFWERFGLSGSLRQYLTATSTVAGVSILNYFLQPLIGVHATALIYLLAVVVLALFVDWGPTLLAAALSAAVWDYIFLPPVFAFRVEHFEDAMLLGMYFVVAIVLGQFTARIRAQEEAERQREERATALYLLTRELSESRNLEQMLQKIVEQTGRVFRAEVCLLLRGATGWSKPEIRAPGWFGIDEKEQGIAAWVFEHGQAAGLFTDNLPVGKALYVPLKGGRETLGVMALKLSQSFPPTVHQRNILDAFSQQIGLALDRQRLQEVSEKTRLLAESERLSKTLLNSVSHEIRTPIAAIRSATSNLAEADEASLSQSQKQMIGEIQEATQRLNRLVGNVLDVTRLETGHVKPKLNLCDVRDLAQVVAKETREQLARHRVEFHIPPKLPLVKMDFVLMQQALANLLSNAAFHTPPGTLVRLSARPEGDFLVITVSDNGPGIPPESLPRVFDKFYRAPNARTGGTGLGLSLVKGFVEAQGGRVTAGNRPDGGAVFTIRQPLSEEKSEVAQ